MFTGICEKEENPFINDVTDTKFGRKVRRFCLLIKRQLPKTVTRTERLNRYTRYTI